MKLSRLMIGIAFFTLLGFVINLYAEPVGISLHHAAREKAFDYQSANRTLDKLAINLSIKNLSSRDLNDAVTQLTALQEGAKTCASDAQDELDKIDQIGKETPVRTDKDLTSLQKYLESKKDDFIEQRSECRLFVLRSGEAITAFSKTVETLNKRQLLASEPGFWARVISNTQITQKLRQQFEPSVFFNDSGLQAFHLLNSLIIGVLLLFSIFTGMKIHEKIKQRLSEIPLTAFSGKLKYAAISVMKRYIIGIFLVVVFSLSISTLGLLDKQITYLMLASYMTLIYILILMLVHFLFYPFRQDESLSGLTPHTAKLLVMRTKSLITLCFLGAIIYVFFYHQLLSEDITDLARMIFITLLAINLISILWLVNHIPKLLSQHNLLRFMISTILTLFLIAIIVTEWLGYQQLVAFILQGIALTLILGFIALTLYKIFNAGLNSFSAGHAEWQKKLHQYLHVKSRQTLPELFCLRILIFIIIWGGVLLLLLNVWGISNTQFHELMFGMTNGFKVAGINIIPSRIIFGLIFFAIAIFLVRWLSAIIENHSGEHINRGSQQALAAVTGYLGFAIVLLFSLLIAGVNFAGLAIIAGALSVGIGFGLQNIVNNFVSGIILLVERPIKPGDRIQVGDTEGFVKKISIRYTQIQTLQYSDLIVPNAEIVSGQVINYMFKDFYGRIGISVGVAYGSDTALVKDTLLEAANNHPEIVSEEGPYQPWVFFGEFGDHSLKFDLFCVIRNVNLKYFVASELRFAIDKLFRERNITIAFPQQDIHIKDWVSET